MPRRPNRKPAKAKRPKPRKKSKTQSKRKLPGKKRPAKPRNSPAQNSASSRRAETPAATSAVTSKNKTKRKEKSPSPIARPRQRGKSMDQPNALFDGAAVIIVGNLPVSQNVAPEPTGPAAGNSNPAIGAAPMEVLIDAAAPPELLAGESVPPLIVEPTTAPAAPSESSGDFASTVSSPSPEADLSGGLGSGGESRHTGTEPMRPAPIAATASPTPLMSGAAPAPDSARMPSAALHSTPSGEIAAGPGGSSVESTNTVAEPLAAGAVFEPVSSGKSPTAPISNSGGPAMLFEVAWEVCWQLGGIYTVLRTKVEQMIKRWGDRYFLIGPYNPQTAAVEFEELPATGVIATALHTLQQMGLSGRFGRWLIPGRPRVILLDYRGRFGSLGHDKYLMWKDHGISTQNDDGEVNEVIAFGFTVKEFLQAVVAAAPNRPIVAHFHEWMAGVAVPRLAHERIPVQTVFTTHATLLGRYLASDSPDFYTHLPFIDPDVQAAKYLIYPRFAIERAAAHSATVFTTVSEVTATEAEKLLGRRPEVILPNGLNIKRFAALHEFQNLHREYKERIHQFVMGHFFPAYTFDLDRTLYVFTSGRYEYRNKGMDLFIEALAQVNQRLRGMPDRPTIVAFIVTKAATRNINVGVLQNQSMFEDLGKASEQIAQQMGKRLFNIAAHGRLPTMSDLLDDDSMVRLKQSIHAWRNGRQPSIVTHDLIDDANDPILRHLRHRWLFNAADDPVKIVFHPQFMSTTSPLINLDYEQFVRGCHMGVFPSYYEPWGYTPMESVALGVPAVTTDLSGFGAYVQRHLPDHEAQGIKVLDRRNKSFDETMNDLADHLIAFASMSRRQRIEQRNKVERLGERFDWSVLVGFYHEAHDLALSRAPAGRFDLRLV
jgi:glycogen(starch) synthase